NEQKRLIQEARLALEKLGTLKGLQIAESAAALAKAEADILQEEDRISRAEKQQQVEVRRAQTELQKAKEEENRIRTLVEQEAAPRKELEKAEATVREADYQLEKAQLEIGKAQLETLRRARDLLKNKYAVQHNEIEIRLAQKEGSIESAEKILKNLELDKSHMEIRAPMNGTITQCGGHKGEIVQRGDSLMVISQQSGMQMEAYVESRDAGLIKTGMKTKIRLEAFDYQKYGTLGGTIVFISPDSNVNEGKVIYSIRIDLDREEIGFGALQGKVKLGMVGTAEIVTGKETILSIVFRKFRKKIDIQ
ncbi:MAG: HlyD family efflux transporter periplasmic adaptor subunit, partial [Planctomycetota bacterium]|nr:HlyD family efflux transporter periplasmic adaptor subunit [Planctomycetota bacterium]